MKNEDKKMKERGKIKGNYINERRGKGGEAQGR